MQTRTHTKLVLVEDQTQPEMVEITMYQCGNGDPLWYVYRNNKGRREDISHLSYRVL